MAKGTGIAGSCANRQGPRLSFVLPFLSYFLPLGLLFVAGCTEQQRAVDLYIDAVMLKDLNQKELAIERLNTAVQVDNRFTRAYSLLGDLYKETGDYQKSAVSYQEATRLNPQSFNDYFNLGQVNQIMGRFAEAVKAYSKACELKPDHLDAHINTAKCYYQVKDYDSALVYSERAEQLDPNVGDIQKILGDIYESKQDYERAIAAYKRALEMDSNNPDIMTALAIAYLRTSRDEPAKELLTSALKIRPTNIAHQYLGYCYLRLGEVDKAIDSYVKAIALNDRDWESFRGIGVAYMLRAISDKDDTLKSRAVEYWRLSLRINPTQPRSDSLRKLIHKYTQEETDGGG